MGALFIAWCFVSKRPLAKMVMGQLMRSNPATRARGLEPPGGRGRQGFVQRWPRRMADKGDEMSHKNFTWPKTKFQRF